MRLSRGDGEFGGGALRNTNRCNERQKADRSARLPLLPVNDGLYAYSRFVYVAIIVVDQVLPSSVDISIIQS